MSRQDILAGETPPKWADVEDRAHAKGAAGIHTSSNPSQFGNIMVIGETQAVDSAGKLATAWATMKSVR